MKRWLWMIVLLLAGPAGGQDVPFDGLGGFGVSNQPWVRRGNIVLSHTQVRAGDGLTAALEIELSPGWVFYSPDPGPSAIAGGLGYFGRLRAGSPLWPADKPHSTELSPGESLINNVYEGKFVICLPLAVPAGTPDGQYSIELVPTGQACGPIRGVVQCILLDGPNGLSRKASVSVGQASVANPQWQGDLADGLAAAMTAEQLVKSHQAITSGPDGTPDYTIIAGLGLALLAGLILNIMPCVLPVIPLKVLGIVEMAKQDGTHAGRRFVTLGLAFAGGILLFFAGLVAVNVGLHVLTHRAMHWGEHFASTGFRIAMVMVVVAVAANMWGLFTITLPGRAESVEGRRRGGHLSAIGSGLLAAVLSTPCSFGLLTSAIAWAQLQSLFVGSAVLATIGLGMAIPYLLLIAFPQLVKWLPRPGRWMELFKKSMGFVMLLVAIWLVSTFSDNAYPLWVAAYAAVLVFCLWVWSDWVRYDAPPARKILVRGVAVALAVAAGWWMLSPAKPLAVQFVPFSQAELSAARQAGRPVLVDFTANWCLTCKTVEHLVYNDPAVAEALRKDNVLTMKGDVTTPDLPANDMLYNKLNEKSVPVSVLFPGDGGQPIRLYGVFSKADLVKALADARKHESITGGR